jgi:DNA-binding transcriptional LysR family regulator
LARESYLIALAEGHPLARKPELRLDDLRGLPFVARPHCEVHASGRRVLANHGIRPRTAARTTNDERALALVAAGLGAALMPECYGAPGVAMAPAAGLDFSRRLGLAWRDDAGDAAAAFRSFAASHDWTPESATGRRLEWAR